MYSNSSYSKKDPYGEQLSIKKSDNLLPNLKKDGFYYSQTISDYYKLGDTLPLVHYNERESNYDYPVLPIIMFDENKNLSFGISLYPNVSDAALQLKNNEEYKTNNVHYPSFFFRALIIQTKYNDINHKIQAFDKIKNSKFFDWNIYHLKNDTLSIQYYNINSKEYGFPPIPILVLIWKLTTLKFKIINDTTLKFFEMNDGNINNPYSKKDYSDSSFYFKFYKTNARIDFSKSFFNTNKRYLRYVERQKRKQEKIKK